MVWVSIFKKLKPGEVKMKGPITRSLLAFLFLPFLLSLSGGLITRESGWIHLEYEQAWAGKGAPSDIQWFKQQMKISPQYVEQKEGVLGMSWAHFFTMGFLVVFSTGALVMAFLRYKRTRELIRLLQEEKENGSNS